MQSSAKTVPADLKEVPAGRKAALKILRELCRLTLTGFKESMAYGGPTYSRNGVVEAGFASQKHFIGLYILRTDVMKTHEHLLKGKGVTFGATPNPSASISRWWRRCCARRKNLQEGYVRGLKA